MGAALLGGTAALASSAGRFRARGSTPPNIIFILADDLGYGDLGCYGQTQILTPNLDYMAAQGMRFTDCYAGSMVCAPSRCSLLTGLHTGHTRIRRNESVSLQLEDFTVAELLQQAGYATAVIGKWQLGGLYSSGTPWLQGFDEFYGYLGEAANYYPSALYSNDRLLPIPGNQDGGEEVYAPDLFTTKAARFIRQNAPRPFFLYLTYAIPHANNVLAKQTGNGMQVPSDAPYTDRPWPQTEKNFAAMITRLDTYLARIRNTLRNQGLLERTLILFSSDNGPHSEGGHSADFFDSNGPLRGIKRHLYEGGIRVPMIAYWPGTIHPGVVSPQVWAFWDFLPTAAEVAGVPLGKGLDGVSILPVLTGQPPFERPDLYWEGYETGPMQQAVRMGSWKGLRLSPASPVQLYDLALDLGEQSDLAGSFPDVVARIEERMRTAHASAAPRLNWSKRPGLEMDGVEPDSGTANSTSFRFEVRAGDLNGADPQSVRLTLYRDGSVWQTVDLTPGHSVNRWGRNYFHVRRLPTGNYSYQFYAADADGEAYLPWVGGFVGPTMEAPPYLIWTGDPGYEEDGVEPHSGEPDSTVFQFRVRYRAHDGDMPEYVKLRLWRDGVHYRTCGMKPLGSATNPVTGLTYAIRRRLPAGEYEYQYQAADRHGEAKGPGSVRCGGVLVGMGGPAAITALTAVGTPAGGAEVRFTLSASAQVSVEVTNLAGRPVAKVVGDRRLSPGLHTFLWGGTGPGGLRAPGGTYLVRVTAHTPDGGVTRRLTTCSIHR